MSQQTFCGPGAGLPPLPPSATAVGMDQKQQQQYVAVSSRKWPPNGVPPPLPPHRTITGGGRPLFQRQERVPSGESDTLSPSGPPTTIKSPIMNGHHPLVFQPLDNHHTEESDGHRGPVVPFSRPPIATINGRFSKSFTFTNGNHLNRSSLDGSATPGSSNSSQNGSPITTTTSGSQLCRAKPIPAPRLTRVQTHVIPEGRVPTFMTLNTSSTKSASELPKPISLPPPPPQRVESIHKDSSGPETATSASEVKLRQPSQTTSDLKRGSMRFSLSEFDTLLAGLEHQISELETWDIPHSESSSTTSSSSTTCKPQNPQQQVAVVVRRISTGTEEEEESDEVEVDSNSAPSSSNSHNSTSTDQHSSTSTDQSKSHSNSSLVSSSLSTNGRLSAAANQRSQDEPDRCSAAQAGQVSVPFLMTDLREENLKTNPFTSGLIAHDLGSSKGSTLSGGRGEGSTHLIRPELGRASGREESTEEPTNQQRHQAEERSAAESLDRTSSSSATSPEPTVSLNQKDSTTSSPRIDLNNKLSTSSDPSSQNQTMRLVPILKNSSQNTQNQDQADRRKPLPAPFGAEDIHPALGAICRGRLSFYENNDDTLVECLTAAQIQTMIDKCGSSENNSSFGIISKTPKLLRRAASFRRTKSRPEGDAGLSSAAGSTSGGGQSSSLLGAILSRSSSPSGGHPPRQGKIRSSPARSISVSSETSAGEHTPDDSMSLNSGVFCNNHNGTLSSSSSSSSAWPTGPIFSCDIESLPVTTGGRILPEFIESSMAHLAAPPAVTTVGLFRKSGVKSRILLIRSLIESPQPDGGKRASDSHRVPLVSVDQLMQADEQITLHDLADVIKCWLRELKPKPLIPADLVKAFSELALKKPSLHHSNHISIQSGGQLTKSKSDAVMVVKPKHLIAHQLRLFRILFKLLSDNHRALLHVVLRFFALIASQSAYNQMTLSNLAICLTPSLCECATEKDLDAAQRCLEYFIENVEELFSVSPADDLITSQPTNNNHSSTSSLMNGTLNHHSNSTTSLWSTASASLRRSNSTAATIKRSQQLTRQFTACVPPVSEGTVTSSTQQLSNMAALTKLPRHSTSTLVGASPLDILVRILYQRNNFDPTVVAWELHETHQAVMAHKQNLIGGKFSSLPRNGNYINNNYASAIAASKQPLPDYDHHNSTSTSMALACRSDLISLKWRQSVFLPTKHILLSRKWLISGDATRVELRETGDLFESKWDIKIFGQGKSLVRHEIALDWRGYSYNWYTATYPLVHEYQLHKLRESFTLDAMYGAERQLNGTTSSRSTPPLAASPAVGSGEAAEVSINPNQAISEDPQPASPAVSEASASPPLCQNVDPAQLQNMRETNV